MDESRVENAEQTSELYRQARLEEARRAAAVDPASQYTGSCWNCGRSVDKPRRWCDAECRDEWEEMQ
mgnify:FL=1